MMNKYELAAALTIAGLDGFTGRMSAKQQRDVFGGYWFGKKQITIDCTGQGRVYGSYSVSSYGTVDILFFEKSFDQICNAVNSGAEWMSF